MHGQTRSPVKKCVIGEPQAAASSPTHVTHCFGTGAVLLSAARLAYRTVHTLYLYYGVQ